MSAGTDNKTEGSVRRAGEEYVRVGRRVVTMATQHTLAIRIFRADIRAGVIGWEEAHPKCPGFIAKRIVAAKRRACLNNAVHFAKLRYKQQFDKISARSAEHKTDIARFFDGLRRVTGLTGENLRKLAVQVHRKHYVWSCDMSVAEVVPDTAMQGAVGLIRTTGAFKDSRGYQQIGAKSPEDVNAMVLWALLDAIRLDIGKPYAEGVIAEYLQDPKAKIGGYFADTLMHWLAGDVSGHGGYEYCSGGEYMTYIRTTYGPDVWKMLMQHAPVGARTDTGVQCYPHERAKIAACRAAGLIETLRLSDSIFSGSPDKVALVATDFDS